MQNVKDTLSVNGIIPFTFGMNTTFCLLRNKNITCIMQNAKIPAYYMLGFQCAKITILENIAFHARQSYVK